MQRSFNATASATASASAASPPAVAAAAAEGDELRCAMIHTSHQLTAMLTMPCWRLRAGGCMYQAT